MGVDLNMWAVNIFFLIGLLFWLFVLALVLILAVSLVRNYFWRRQKQAAARADFREKHDANGKRLPDFQRGICDRCGQVEDKVYFFPAGPKICHKCYSQPSSGLGAARDIAPMSAPPQTKRKTSSFETSADPKLNPKL